MNQDLNPITIERATERLRQERETFDQQKSQEGKWFWLRLAIGYSSIVLLSVVIFIASYILFNSGSFSNTVVTAAGGALFVDVLGLLLSVWKIVLNPKSITKLSPVTQIEQIQVNTITDGNDATPQQLVE